MHAAQQKLAYHLLASLVLGAVAYPAVGAKAAELRLRPEARAGGEIVLLSDVADFYTADAAESERLARIELFPTPTAGQPRHVSVREIQDLLARRGESLAGLRFSGANRVTVAAGELGSTTGSARRPLSAPLARRARERVRRAILNYMTGDGAAENLQVDVDLDDQQARAVGVGDEPLEVRGGRSPWLGTQHFEIRSMASSPSSAAPATITVTAVVSQPANVVVARRAIRRGDVIQASDVELAPLADLRSPLEAVAHLEDAVGREAMQTIPAGQALDFRTLRAPILVRRGEAVTVFARSAGVEVRTVGRSRGEGGYGELITIESMLNRATFFARVSGPQEVEIYAGAIRPASSDAITTDDGQVREARTR